MSMENGISPDNKPIQHQPMDDFGSVDMEKFLGIIKKSLIWVGLIIAVCISIAYLIIRYTPETFESTSVLQLDVKSEASVFGFKSFDGDIYNISKEIEFLRSNLFLGKVAEEIDLSISYYAIGDILNNERYKNNSFTVSYNIENTSYFDRNFEIDILNESDYIFKFTDLNGAYIEDNYHFGDSINYPGFAFFITLNTNYDPSDDNVHYFFRINSQSSLINYLSKNITVQPLDFKANTITLSFKDNNKTKAMEMVEALDTLYLYYTKQEKNKETEQKINFLNQQLKATEEKLSEIENYFEDFTIEYKTTNFDANLSKTIVLLEQLDSQKYLIQRKIQTINSVYSKVLNEEVFIISSPELALLPGNIQQEISNYEKLVNQKKQLENSYKPNTYVIKKTESELDFITERITLYINEYNSTLTEQLTALNQRRQQLESEFVTMPSKKTEFSKTERYYSLYEEFYLSLIKNKAAFELAQAGTTTNYKILSPASSPGKPISPNALLYFGIGAIIGIFISVFFIGIRYLIHNKITSQNELEHLTFLPVIGSIPNVKKEADENSRLLIDKFPKSELSESFRSLRTNLEFLNQNKEKPILCITSSTSGEGKTFVTVNLGGIISLVKNKVIIIDLDMRKPRLQKVFYDNVASKGVSTILIGKTDTKDAILKTNLENMDYIPSGPIPPNPAELIAGDYFDKMINELKEIYDVIIIDTPPVGLVTDGIAAMKKATIPLFVVRADFSKKSFINSINKLSQIHRFNHPSIVLNSVKKSGTYGYGYGKDDHGYYEEQEDPKLFKIKSLFGL